MPATAPAATAPGLPPLTWQGKVLADAIMEVPAVYHPRGGRTAGRVRASPASRRAARERGLSLDNLTGTGPRGRITVSDVESAPGGGTTTTDATLAPPPPDQVVRNSQMRKTIARRLKAAYLDAPTFFLTVRFDAERMVDLRAQLAAGGLKVSVNDLLVKAIARALRQVPEVNASWGEDAITRHGAIHIGIAVALPEGLITPVLRDADRKSLAAIASETRDLVQRARERKLQPEEYQGSTFTISNLGMMDIEEFTAILNPPEAAILAVGAVQQEPVAKDGQLVVRPQIRTTMTCDHRVVDGALGARFLQALREGVENPALLVR